ncbi:MAG: phosphate--AMP phosphotransferase, partial [Pirellulaceae bacterium]|nr:phosphate--AMP phosphotransferase [Pirellulaceae bacterium]
IVKFWLHIDQDEQLRRFQARQNTPEKQWKITEEDWRNREKYAQYRIAVVDMLQRTSTTYAPWTILEANCKLYARIKALRTVAKVLEDALEHRLDPR